jgi:hypothetical protein
VVVTTAAAGRAEAEAAVHLDGGRVRDPDLEREPRAGPGLVEEALDQLGGDAAPAPLRMNRDVHQVPDVVVSRADEIADEALFVLGRETDPRRLGELQHEHRERPGRWK